MCVLHGTGFFQSGKDAFHLIKRNVLNIFVVHDVRAKLYMYIRIFSVQMMHNVTVMLLSTNTCASKSTGDFNDNLPADIACVRCLIRRHLRVLQAHDAA